MTKLKNLYLNGTKVTDAGLAHLKTLNGLQVLMFKNTAVGDAGLAHLTGLTTLHHLVLNGTKVTDAGVQALQTAVPRLRITRQSGVSRAAWIRPLRRIRCRRAHFRIPGISPGEG